MSATALPSFMSRTMPTNDATAPTCAFPCRSDAISRPASKSSVCTRPGILASGYRREESDFVAVGDARVALRHVLIDRRAHWLGAGKFGPPGTAARDEESAQAIQITHAGGQREL